MRVCHFPTLGEKMVEVGEREQTAAALLPSRVQGGHYELLSPKRGEGSEHAEVGFVCPPSDLTDPSPYPPPTHFVQVFLQFLHPGALQDSLRLSRLHWLCHVPFRKRAAYLVRWRLTTPSFHSTQQQMDAPAIARHCLSSHVAWQSIRPPFDLLRTR